MLSTVIKSPILEGQIMVLLKKFLMAFAIVLYSIVPVSAGDSDWARGHWQGQDPKMLNLKACQYPAWGHLKKAHLEGMRASAAGLRLTKKRVRTAFQRGAGGKGLISRYKNEYQISVGRSLARTQRLLVGAPSHRFRSGQSKGSGMHWDKGPGKNWGQGHSKNSNKRYGMNWSKGSGMHWDKGSRESWGKGCDQDWGQRYGKKPKKRHGMGRDKGVGKRGDQSRGDKSQKNRKKKSFDSD